MTLTEPINIFLAGIRANPRLRLGLWLILGIAWFYGILLLRDQARDAATAHQSTARKMARIQAQAGQDEWLARVGPARALQLELENSLWHESTIGLAQAAFQDWLNQTIQQSGLIRPAVSMAAQEENSAETGPDQPLWKVSAKISFDFTPQSLYALLERIEGNDKQIVVETLVIRGAPVPRAEMLLSAPFQKPAGTESGATDKPE